MERFDLENFPISESAKKMLGYVSDGFYDSSYVGKWLFQVMGIEYDKALEIVTELPAQFFPETATWGLLYHEIKWGLPVRLNLSYEERRRLIYRKRDYRAPMTPYRMEIYLSGATGFEVHVADANDLGGYGFMPPHPNMFKVFFIGEDTLDVKLVKGILDRLKQSHTIYTLNDRIEIVIDHRGLERMFLRRVTMRMKMPFWACNIFDGTWKFDGSILMDAKRRYDLMVKVRCQGSGSRMITQEDVRLPVMAVHSRVVTHGEMDSARVFLGFDIDFFGPLRFNGSSNFDGVNRFDTLRHPMGAAVWMRSQVRERESMGNASVLTQRDPGYFDGSRRFDGTRTFNAIYREEEL